MTNNLYVVYNKLSKRYGDVFCSPTNEFAGRQMAQIFSNPANTAYIREEIEVCCVGSINIETGIINAASAPVRIDIPDTPRVDIDSACVPSEK